MGMGVMRHWRDGSWATAWRRDVVVCAELDGRYTVTISRGPQEARAWFADLGEAEVGEAHRHLLPDVQWRELSESYRRARPS
ncbi:hypothetical protein GCM10010124_41170 [Pilimelia terevasa]|uniref:Uncharacterized protein n=1 Tax=Pilimelia terevasa TaxID=53372 RepID=A0A8J3BV72_9ACTN|nr:hypothetical protein [Pilimelia terevasa]GGK44113.1 hypothetical protein GCM10010124_41170 [Pilimelia terevasa]